MNRLTIGIIGCGAITEQFHLPILRKLSMYDVRWLCDLDGLKAQRVAKAFGVSQAYSSLTRCPDVDSVLVATPVGSRLKILSITSGRGWHVLAEKPFAMDVNDHIQMLQDGEKNSVIMTTGFMRRFYWATETGASLINTLFDGEPLEVIASDCDRIKRTIHSDSWYLANPEMSGGGFLMETGSHLIDQALSVVRARNAKINFAEQKVFDRIDFETIAKGELTDAMQRQVPLRLIQSKLRDQWSGIAITSRHRKLEVPLYPGQPIVLSNTKTGSRTVLPCPHDLSRGVIEAYATQFIRFADRISKSDTASNADATGLLTTAILSRCYGRPTGNLLN